ncbi:hypothetical protein N7478_002290 [Penicillium angulare]|uniref:uncharacterized protein n=1 Tax=Penicillium angulare TaxID=116970 RepID=UPI0025426424|nr:uncharacterized protein N7478_002290 [Penicillium angulare]KAJ5286604.1 hypothetical protein N7478_002290 [Penicillium angulare]
MAGLRLFGPRGRLRTLSTLAVLSVLVFIRGLSLLQSARNTRPENPYDDFPHYRHFSKYRDDPDTKYEEELSRAMHDIEQKELHLHGSENPPDIIWQMLLKDMPTMHKTTSQIRGDDSLQMEQQNSEWAYKLVNGQWAEEFVTITLSTIPGLAKLYHSYPHYVHRSDLLRYLILWYYGGYYADIDARPVQSIKKCPKMQDSLFGSDDPDVSLVLGIEIDEPFASAEEMHYWHWVRRYGFLQYSIYAPRRFSPLLREVIVRVLSHTKRHIDESSIFLGPQYNELTTLEITGPGVFTDAILDVLSDSLPASHPLVEQSVKADTEIGDLIAPGSSHAQSRVSWAPFHLLQDTLCVNASEAKPGKRFGGLCVLPINVWANGQRHSNSESFRSSHACINHRFGGTWKLWRQDWKKKILG